MRGISGTSRHVRRKCLKITIAAVSAAMVLWYMFCLPRNLFGKTEYSTVVVDRNGELIGARISGNGEWRFSGKPAEKSVSDGERKYFTAVIQFEDRWFRWHPGVNPVSIARALISNIRSGHVVSGGSTITMQVIRMSRHRERTLGQKLTEAVMATRLELRYSKDEILRMYADNAPFGGNVAGLEAASWRYFGRPSSELSWGEAATLAVLPNAPSSIRIEKNRGKLLEKRNRLLVKLRDKGYLNPEECLLACSEPLPKSPKPLPSSASHLTDDIARNRFCEKKGYSVILSVDGRPWKSGDRTAGRYVQTSIDLNLQRRLEAFMDRRCGELAEEGINDLAAIVEDVGTGEILAWCGNSDPDRKRPGVNVNAARAPRSSGSILKPFLYHDALADGTILPYSLVEDTPVNINGFSPQNYDMSYAGAVPAAEALSRSLNVPSVHMLKKYGVRKFMENLQKRGLTTLTRDASDYGLSLILGGAECRLDEVTAAYAEMSANYMNGTETDDKVALYYTFDALKDVNRPDEIDWHLIHSVRKIAWKTGTSYGYRDAWAVGVTPSYAVGVWAGNASGAGAAGLLGARTAGPVLFGIFNMLPDRGAEWFPEPAAGDGIRMEVCGESGFVAGQCCGERDTLLLPKTAAHSATCPYHHMEDGRKIFRLPPAMEWFYRQRHPEYEDNLHRNDISRETGGQGNMEFIYPENGSRISLPRQLDGSPGRIVLNLAHHDRNATVYWHLDRTYIGETRFLHQKRVLPEKGKHSITAVDNHGETISISITVL